MPLALEVILRVLSCDGTWAWTAAVAWWLIRLPLEPRE